MKKQLVLALALALLSTSSFSQKTYLLPAKKYKEVLFKTPEYAVQQNLIVVKGERPKHPTGMIQIKDVNELPKAPPVEAVPYIYNQCQEELADPNSPTMDMRDYDIITQVEDQGGCGSCWDFASVAGLETSEILVNGLDVTTLRLSEEQVLSCTGGSNSCGGGMQMDAAGYMKSNHIVTYGTWSYTGAQQTNLCGNYQNMPGSYIAQTWGYVCDPFSGCFTPSESQIKAAICKYGSVVCAVSGADGSAWQDYYPTTVNQVINTGGGSNILGIPLTDHCIQIIGWDDNLGAWLIKNSWSTGWGYNGFAWVKYGTGNIGAFAIWIQAAGFQNPCAYSQTDCMVHDLILQFNTGDDNLGGGSTNCNVCLDFTNGTYEQWLNVNNGAAWNNNSTNSVTVRLANPVPLTNLKYLQIYTKSCSGISCDNWNLNGLTVTAVGGFANDVIYSSAGSPLYRFTGTNYSQLFSLTNLGPCGAPPPPANPTTNQLLVDFTTGGDDLRQGDPLNVTLSFSNGTTQTFSNVNGNADWNNNSSHVVTLNLSSAVNPSTITKMEMAIQHCGGISCDNWNLQSIKVTAVENNQSQDVIYSNSGNPFYRFTGNNNTYTINL